MQACLSAGGAEESLEGSWPTEATGSLLAAWSALLQDAAYGPVQ